MTQGKRHGTTRVDGAQTRAELIRLGLERFPLKGDADSTIDDLGAGTQISRSSWYDHFGDKDEFFLVVLRSRTPARGAWWRVADDPAVETIEQAVAAATATFARVDPDFETWIMLLYEYWHRQREHPERLAVLRDLYEGYVRELAEFVDRLRVRGLVASPKPSRQLAAAMFAMNEGAQAHGAVYGARGIVDVDMLTALLRAGER